MGARAARAIRTDRVQGPFAAGLRPSASRRLPGFTGAASSSASVASPVPEGTVSLGADATSDSELAASPGASAFGVVTAVSAPLAAAAVVVVVAPLTVVVDDVAAGVALVAWAVVAVDAEVVVGLEGGAVVDVGAVVVVAGAVVVVAVSGGGNDPSAL